MTTTTGYSFRFSVENQLVDISDLLLNESDYIKLGLRFRCEGPIELRISKEIFELLNSAKNFETLKISKRKIEDVTEAARSLGIRALYKRCIEIKVPDLLSDYMQHNLSEAGLEQCYHTVNEWLFLRENGERFAEFFPKKWSQLPKRLQKELPLTISHDFKGEFKDRHLKVISNTCTQISSLDLTECKALSSKALKYLKNFSELSSLILRKTQVTSTDIENFVHNTSCDVGDLDLTNDDTNDHTQPLEIVLKKSHVKKVKLQRKHPHNRKEIFNRTTSEGRIKNSIRKRPLSQAFKKDS